jgi:hypothetical protein
MLTSWRGKIEGKSAEKVYGESLFGRTASHQFRIQSILMELHILENYQGK